MIEPFEGTSPEIDASVYFHPRATIIGKVTIGKESSVWPGVVMRGDDGTIAIGEKTSIQDGTIVHMTQGLSNTAIGDRVTVGHNAIIHGCTVGDDVLVGMGAIILDNAVVGAGSIVGAGALIPMNKEVPPGVLVVGNPFRLVRDLTDKDRQWIEISWRSYVEKSRIYLAKQAGEATAGSYAAGSR